MLSKLFEWYRVVNASPSDDIIEKRKASATALLEHLASAPDYELLLACVTGAVNGFESGFDQKSNIVTLVVESIRKHQPAFPEDLSENALELRMSCATVMGEILNRSLQSTDTPDGRSLLAASLFTSAIPAHPPIRARHLQTVLNELARMAKDVTERGSLDRRKRVGFFLQEFDEIKAAALPTFWEGLSTKLKSCLTNLQQQAAAHREELDVLWWMYTGFSTKAGKALEDLEPGELSFCCGAELANLVMPPPTRSSSQMVRRAIRDHCKTNGGLEMSLKKLAVAWRGDLLPLLAPDEGVVKQLVQTHPPLLPISWLCNRLRESGGAAGWGEEFAVKTGIPDGRQLSLEDWGVQIFNERIAQRSYLGILEDKR
ncbi:MAG: GTPase-associated system all-helical protein GASH [Limisphaerales bacterium]